MSRPAFTADGPGYTDPAELEDGDALVGGEAICRFVNELLGTSTSITACFKRLKLGQIPAQKVAGSWIGSKRGLRRFYARGTGLAA
jgi:hypothetical protein